MTRPEATDTQIRSLMREAREHGDDAQVFVCASALAGQQVARRRCAKVIADAEAAKEPDCGRPAGYFCTGRCSRHP